MNGVKLAGIDLDRKILAELAVNEPNSFKLLAEQAAQALKSNKAA